MPIFSAANATQFPEDQRYIPTTEIHPAQAPEYAFYIYPEDGFRAKYNFDNCRHFHSFNRGFSYQEIDFNHQDLHYKRLFALKNVIQRPTFYLCPWLVIPFEAVSSSATPMFQPKLNNLQLVVKPYSIYDGKSSRKIKARIVRNNPDPANGRTLKLFSSGNGVRASWANPKTASSPTIIDELACVAAQKINVTIDDLPTAYDFSSFIEIRCVTDASTNSYITLGRVYLVFFEVLNRNVIFFDVHATPNSQSKVDIRILGSTGSTQPDDLKDKLEDLNQVYERIGLRYAAPNVSISLSTSPSPFVTGDTITFETGVTLTMSDSDEGPQIARIFKKKITAINGTVWNENINEYLFVFLMAISPSTIPVPGDPTSVTKVAGSTTVSLRAPCVFTYSRKTLAHESAHGLGLRHSFYDEKGGHSSFARSAEISARQMLLLTTEDLYLFCDEVNTTGLNSTITNRFGQTTQVTRYERALSLWGILQTTLYYIYSTDNLLDYQQSSQAPIDLEQLRKDQLEQIRFYA